MMRYNFASVPIKLAILVGSFVFVLISNGCSIPPTVEPETTEIPTPLPISDTPISPAPQPETTITPEPTVDPFENWNSYTNDAFKISFKYPSGWYGPDVYQVDQDIRLAVGSDVVYPYGTDRLDQIYEVKNSYYILIQYRKNLNNWTLEEYNENQPWITTLLGLEDGEAISSARALYKRVREIELGRFKGLEYIATLSESAQTEYFYSRQVILFDEDLNVLMISGSPNNVEINSDGNWQDAYQKVDEENQDVFYTLLDSIVVE